MPATHCYLFPLNNHKSLLEPNSDSFYIACGGTYRRLIARYVRFHSARLHIANENKLLLSDNHSASMTDRLPHDVTVMPTNKNMTLASNDGT
jgi:hypothetical protein